MKIFFSAGHNNVGDNGAIVNEFKESEIVMSIRDKVKDILKDAIFVPDNLSLRETIDFINAQSLPDDLCIEIHLNSNGDKEVRGTEAYYISDPKLALHFSKIIAEYCDFINLGAKDIQKKEESLGFDNRGARPDSQTHVGSLGFLRQTHCQSVLIELCYLSNFLDRSYIISENGQNKVAEAIVKGIKLLWSQKDETNGETKEKEIENLKQQISLLQKVLELLKSLRDLLSGTKIGRILSGIFKIK